MGQIEFVVKDGGDKEGGGFGAKDEGSERGRLKSSGAGTADFGGGKISFRADEEIQRWGFCSLSNCYQ
jgi:hypothetical protein